MRKTSNYLEIIVLLDPTYMMSMADLVAIGVDTTMIDSGCYFEKELIELISMNP